MVTIRTIRFNITKSSPAPHSVSMCFVGLRNINTFDVRRDTSVGAATRYLLDGGGEISRTRPDRPWGPPISLYTGHGVVQGVKRPGRGVPSHHLHLAPR